MGAHFSALVSPPQGSPAGTVVTKNSLPASPSLVARDPCAIPGVAVPQRRPVAAPGRQEESGLRDPRISRPPRASGAGSLAVPPPQAPAHRRPGSPGGSLLPILQARRLRTQRDFQGHAGRKRRRVLRPREEWSPALTLDPCFLGAIRVCKGRFAGIIQPVFIPGSPPPRAPGPEPRRLCCPRQEPQPTLSPGNQLVQLRELYL